MNLSYNGAMVEQWTWLAPAVIPQTTVVCGAADSKILNHVTLLGMHIMHLQLLSNCPVQCMA